MCLKKTNGGGGGGGGSQLSIFPLVASLCILQFIYVYFSLALKFGWKGTKVLNNLDEFRMD